MSPSERETLIRINAVPGFGPKRVQSLLRYFGSFEAMHKASIAQFCRIRGVAEPLARKLYKGLRDARLSERELKLAAAAGVRIVTRQDLDYPAMLEQLDDPPLLLYVRGNSPLRTEPSVAIVGCRNPSHYGLRIAQKLAHDLALRGVSVVSGLARGIDAAAHRGALQSEGKTVAFLGGGLGRIYPAEHRELAEAVAAQGALYSEFPISAEPLPGHFPMRNRLVSGVSLGVIVVEAAPRSGSLITARLGLEQGKEIFAVPGPIDCATAKGPNRLIQDGAQLVTSAEEVMEALRLQPEVLQQVEQMVAPMESEPASGLERRLLAQLHSRKPCYAETLLGAIGEDWISIQQALMSLELRGRVKRLPGNQYQKISKGKP